MFSSVYESLYFRKLRTSPLYLYLYTDGAATVPQNGQTARERLAFAFSIFTNGSVKHQNEASEGRRRRRKEEELKEISVCWC